MKQGGCEAASPVTVHTGEHNNVISLHVADRSVQRTGCPNTVCCVLARLRGPGRGSCSVHGMSVNAGVLLLMVPYVTTLPPSFLRLMSVT